MDAKVGNTIKIVPPAPTPHPSPLRLPALARTLWRNPLEAWSEKHFNEPLVSVNLMVRQAALVNDPVAVRRILLDNAANYGREPIQKRIMSSALRDGLLMADGDHWARQRRILAPLFTRKSVRDFAPAVVETIEDFKERLSGKVGSHVDLSEEIPLLTLEVLERTIFSDGFGTDAAKVRESMRKYFETIGRIEPFDFLGLPDYIPRLGDMRVRKELRSFNETVDRIIAMRRTRHPTRAKPDLLTLLLEARDPETGETMSEHEVRANVITFIAAGHETTANAIMWSLYLLSQSKEWRERVIVEAEEASAAPIESRADLMPDTRAVIEEAIRLYPPIAAISRSAHDKDTLAGHTIGKNALIVVAPYVLHRHRRLWEEPDVFDPSRFLGARRDKIDRFAYMPFGFGPRMCVGQPFALQEATLAVAELTRAFNFEPVIDAKVWPTLRITVRPENGLPMKITKATRLTIPQKSASNVQPLGAEHC